MNDTIVTVVGNVVDSPRRVSLENGAVTNFRLASTPRRYDTRTGQFVDDKTFWIDVECWNALSSNVSASVSKGDPVIVHGVLFTDEWESETGPRSKPRIKASAVGPNLQKGRSSFTKDPRRTAEAADTSAEGPLTAVADDAEQEEESPTSVEDLEAGRDYVVEGEAFDMRDADLPREPAHA